MRTILFGCLLAVCSLSTQSAFAKNIKTPQNNSCCSNQCDPCCPKYVFDGLYFGGNIGAISHLAQRRDLDGFGTSGSGVTLDTNVTIGFQIGYDWQFCYNKLFGLVGDWAWANNSSSIRGIENESDWFSTIRARAGMTVCDALVYVTAGAAVSHIETKWQGTATHGSVRFNDARWGWVAGVGTELAIACKWTLGADVLFLQFDRYTNSKTIGTTAYKFSSVDADVVGRISLNYRFGDFCSWWGK